MTTKTTGTFMPGPDSSDALAKAESRRPRLVARVYESRPSTEYRVLFHRFRRAVLNDDADALVAVAKSMSQDERHRALEDIAAESDRSDMVKGYWTGHDYSGTEPRGAWSTVHPRPEQTREPAPAPRPTGPTFAPINGTGPLRAMERGTIGWFEFEGMRRHVKALKWGPKGVQAIDPEGNVFAITWQDWNTGIHQDSLADHTNKIAKSREAAQRRAWATLGPLENLSPAERFVKSRS